MSLRCVLDDCVMDYALSVALLQDGGASRSSIIKQNIERGYDRNLIRINEYFRRQLLGRGDPTVTAAFQFSALRNALLHTMLHFELDEGKQEKMTRVIDASFHTLQAFEEALYRFISNIKVTIRTQLNFQMPLFNSSTAKLRSIRINDERDQRGATFYAIYADMQYRQRVQRDTVLLQTEHLFSALNRLLFLRAIYMIQIDKDDKKLYELSRISMFIRDFSSTDHSIRFFDRISVFRPTPIGIASDELPLMDAIMLAVSEARHRSSSVDDVALRTKTALALASQINHSLYASILRTYPVILVVLMNCAKFFTLPDDIASTMEARVIENPQRQQFIDVQYMPAGARLQAPVPSQQVAQLTKKTVQSFHEKAAKLDIVFRIMSMVARDKSCRLYHVDTTILVKKSVVDSVKEYAGEDDE